MVVLARMGSLPSAGTPGFFCALRTVTLPHLPHCGIAGMESVCKDGTVSESKHVKVPISVLLADITPMARIVLALLYSHEESGFVPSLVIDELSKSLQITPRRVRTYLGRLRGEYIRDDIRHYIARQVPGFQLRYPSADGEGPRW